MGVLTVKNFKNTDQKNICGSIVLAKTEGKNLQKNYCSIVFKAESKPKHEEKICWGVFFKNALF